MVFRAKKQHKSKNSRKPVSSFQQFCKAAAFFQLVPTDEKQAFATRTVTIGVAGAAKGAMPPQICRKYSNFVL